ncbi:putative reverse transcriptase domain-containing protein, partial [Tanacetum coccineum]
HGRHAPGRQIGREPIWGCDRLVSRAKVIENQVMAISVISVSSNSSEDSVGTHAGRVILFGTIPTTIPDTTPVITPPTTQTNTTDSDTPDTPPSPTHGTPFTETTLSTQRSPTTSGALRRQVMVLAPGQPIPHGRPYRYHLNGPVHMMTVRKRVRPLPTHRLAVRHSVDYSSSNHFSLDDSSSDSSSSSSSETSLDSPMDALSDSASSRSSYDHSLPASPSGMRSTHRLCSLVPSVHRSSSISERPSHDSSYASRSRKRSRSPVTSVPLSSPTLEALYYARADLLPSPKRIRSPETATDLEDCSEDSFEPYVPREVGLGVDFKDESFEPSRYRGADLEMDIDVVRSDGIEINPEIQKMEETEMEEIEMEATEMEEIEMEEMETEEMEMVIGTEENMAITSEDLCLLERVVGLTRWFEKMEIVFHISNYPEKYQVKYALCTLLNSGLTWNEIQKMETELWNLTMKGNDLTAYTQRFQELILLCTRMVPNEEDTVERFIGGLPNNIQGNGYAARSDESKRRMESNSRDNHRQQPPFKRQNISGQNVVRAYTTGNNEMRGYTGPHPLCNKCKYHHVGPCTMKRNICKKVGHLTRDFTAIIATNTQRALIGNQQGAVCYECRRPGNFRKDCPKLRNQNRGNQTRKKVGNKTGNQTGGNEAIAKAYAIGEWLKFNNCNFSLDSRKKFRKGFLEIRIKEIECLEGLDFEEFGALHEGIALQNLNQFCHVSYEQDDRRFTSQAWNRLFRIKEQVVRELLGITDLKITKPIRRNEERRNNEGPNIRSVDNDEAAGCLFVTAASRNSSFTFRDRIEELDVTDTMVFQLGRHIGKEKFLCDKAKGSKRKSPIVGAHLIGWIASYYGLMTLGALMNVTLGPETSSMSVAKLVDLGICRYNGLGIGEMVAEIPEVAGDDDDGAGQAEIGGYDQFYGEFGQWRTGQERFISWNTDHLSQLLAHHHIDHTRYDGTRYSYVPDIPNLGVQQGVNFMSSTPGYSTTPSPSAS